MIPVGSGPELHPCCLYPVKSSVQDGVVRSSLPTQSRLHFVIVEESLSALRKFSGFIKNPSKGTSRKNGGVKVCYYFPYVQREHGENEGRKEKGWVELELHSLGF